MESGADSAGLSADPESDLVSSASRVRSFAALALILAKRACSALFSGTDVALSELGMILRSEEVSISIGDSHSSLWSSNGPADAVIFRLRIAPLEGAVAADSKHTASETFGEGSLSDINHSEFISRYDILLCQNTHIRVFRMRHKLSVERVRVSYIFN